MSQEGSSLGTALRKWCWYATDQAELDVLDWCLAVRYRDRIRRHLQAGDPLDDGEREGLDDADRCMIDRASTMQDYLGFYRWVVQQPPDHYAHTHHRAVMASWQRQEAQSRR